MDSPSLTDSSCGPSVSVDTVKQHGKLSGERLPPAAAIKHGLIYYYYYFLKLKKKLVSVGSN